MERQRAEAAAIPAELTASSTLGHKLGLDSATTPCDGFGPAPLAARSLLGADQRVLRLAMPPAAPHHGPPAVANRGIDLRATRSALRLESVGGDPVANRGSAPIQSLRDLAMRQSSSNQWLELLAREPPAGRVLRAPVRHQPVALAPISDGRGVAADELGDLLEGPSFVHPSCKRIAIHVAIVPPPSDGNTNMRSCRICYAPARAIFSLIAARSRWSSTSAVSPARTVERRRSTNPRSSSSALISIAARLVGSRSERICTSVT